ncbi:MAG: NUDIX domain-containing protein [Cohaesibacteraceae bacterium]|nr:NUDIX domain-containing protein [Cohaesibacteraceae bacterium]
MHDFEASHLGKIRLLVGPQLLLVPGARIVIENANGKILLQKRADLNIWGLPGGNAEPGEDLSGVIEREVFEETGLAITNALPFGFGCNPDLETIRFPNGDQCQFFVLNFHTMSFTGELRMLDGESLALEWYAKDALPEMLPNMKASILAYHRFRTTGIFQMI